MALRDTLRHAEWWPTPAVCFVTTCPKAREIHATDFADRVVHHWLVPRLEALYGPVFIHDSYSNRKGKGTHAAVERLQVFMRQVRDGSGGGKGWCLQLNIKNFFNRVHRPALYELLKRRLLRYRGRSRATLDSMAPHGGCRDTGQQRSGGTGDPDPCIDTLRCNPAQVEALRAQLASYQGHFSHAGSAWQRAWVLLTEHYPWLTLLFIAPEVGNFHLRATPAGVTSYASQVRWFVRHYLQFDYWLVQRGNRCWLHPGVSRHVERYAITARHRATVQFQAMAADTGSLVTTPPRDPQRATEHREALSLIRPGVVRTLCCTTAADGLSCGVVAEHG